MKTETAEELIKKLMVFYNVFSMHELATQIGISQPAISKWKKTNSISAIKKKCRELGIYNEIFGDINTNINNLQNSEFNSSIGVNNGNNTNMNSKVNNIDENILKLVDTLYSFAKTNNKIDELKTDLSALLRKYM
jgi:predicted transcriptional regulator